VEFTIVCDLEDVAASIAIDIKNPALKRVVFVTFGRDGFTRAVAI
jgi:hypothetical protein